LARERAARIPPKIIPSELPKTFPAEYIRNFRPEVTIGWRRILKHPRLSKRDTEINFLADKQAFVAAL
jgi:hypothetical protein